MKASKQFWRAVGATVFVSLLLFVAGALRNQTLDYWYLPYNLALAAVPLGLAYWGKGIAKKYRLKDWRPISAFTLWLLFLPNSFYIVTDFIHLPETTRVDLVQDSVMIMLYSMLGGLFGFMSLFTVKKCLQGMLKQRTLELVIGGALFLSSFAIYLGRELRLNSWDVVANPFVLIGNVADIIVHPGAHPGMIWMTLTFFIVLGSVYLVLVTGRQATKSA